MVVKIFHAVPFNSLTKFGRPTTIEIAKSRAKNHNATPDEWKILRGSFSPKSKSSGIETLNINFYAEGFGDVIAIGQTGQGYLNSIPGIFDVTSLLKQAKQVKLTYLERDPLTKITVKNNSNSHFELQDQNGISQGQVVPKGVANIESWHCKLILVRMSNADKLLFNPYHVERTFVMQNQKVFSKVKIPHPENEYGLKFIELQIA